MRRLEMCIEGGAVDINLEQHGLQVVLRDRDVEHHATGSVARGAFRVAIGEFEKRFKSTGLCTEFAITTKGYGLTSRHDILFAGLPALFA